MFAQRLPTILTAIKHNKQRLVKFVNEVTGDHRQESRSQPKCAQILAEIFGSFADAHVPRILSAELSVRLILAPRYTSNLQRPTSSIEVISYWSAPILCVAIHNLTVHKAENRTKVFGSNFVLKRYALKKSDK